MIARFGTRHLFKLWNPRNMFTDKSGNRIRDIITRRRSDQLSAKLLKLRAKAERKTYRCGIKRKLDLSGD